MRRATMLPEAPAASRTAAAWFTRPHAPTCWVGRTARCPQFAGPFPCGPPPNRTCQFPGIRLSSDLRRECVCGWWPFGMDLVVAGRADYEGLAPSFRHEPGPCWLAGAGICEVGEPGSKFVIGPPTVDGVTPAG